jgi:hypothetical protein
MSKREAVQILMYSPIYWRLTLKQRLQCIADYCKNFNAA